MPRPRVATDGKAPRRAGNGSTLVWQRLQQGGRVLANPGSANPRRYYAPDSRCQSSRRSTRRARCEMTTIYRAAEDLIGERPMTPVDSRWPQVAGGPPPHAATNLDDHYS